MQRFIYPQVGSHFQEVMERCDSMRKLKLEYLLRELRCSPIDPRHVQGSQTRHLAPESSPAEKRREGTTIFGGLRIADGGIT